MAGVPHELLNGNLVLGRSRDCDVTIDDPSASRRHAEIRRDGGAWLLVDLASTNGTEVNGEPIERATLADGDRITIGQTELRFERR
jgi:pSer/pThr/pTyr-binding forkhead associated (FHA) protein